MNFFTPKYSKYITLLLLGLISNSLMASGQTSSEDWQSLYEPYFHQGMPYRIMKPLDFNSNELYPIIISLHGAGGRGTDNQRQLKIWNKQLAQEINRKRYPSYVIAPQSDTHWEIERFEWLKQIIEALPAVDSNRIYILGHSMGGHGTFLWTQHDSDYFAAAVASAGTGRTGRPEFIIPERIKNLPLWVLHGEKDKICPYKLAKKLLKDMQEFGGKMKLTTWKNQGHNISHKIIPGDKKAITVLASKHSDPEDDLLKWLFKQRKP
jgi:predicted peptidase